MGRCRGCAGKSSAPWVVVEMASQRESAAGFAWLGCSCGQSQGTPSSTGHLGAGRGSVGVCVSLAFRTWTARSLLRGGTWHDSA